MIRAPLLAATGQQQILLSPIREDLRLYPGPRHLDGSPSWRILDPVRNAFFEIGWLEFELLARWRNHRSAEELVAQVARETSLAPTLDEARELIEFLTKNQLLVPASTAVRDELRRRLRASKRSWHEYLLHHYLFFRLPLFQPDAFLARTVGLVEPLFSRGFALLVLAVFGLDLYLLSRDWHSFSESFLRVFTAQGIVHYAIALTFAKVVHELGHAYAARRYGVRVPNMGIAFMVLWPFLYTDTGETWKLADRRKQLVIASAGVAAELALATFATLLWALSPEGAAKNVLFVLASSTWLMTLAINASPFMRFDGYFILSDALDFPNLHERGFACARWWLRRVFFGLEETLPEPALSPRSRGWLIAFAFMTWIYRLVVFLGIALLIYHLFFKLLGVVLMAVEILWFIVRPIWFEVAYLWSRRKLIRLAWRPALSVIGVLLVGVWLMPVAREVSAPALIHAAQEQSVYAPFPGQVREVAVAPNQAVRKGDVLVRLEAKDLRVRSEQADVAVASARAELARMPASLQQQERQQVLEQRLAEALASRKAVDEEFASQQLTAANDGIVRELPRDLVLGRWVNPAQLLMRVVSEETPLIEAFVSEHQVSPLAAGQSVRFYPELPGMPVVRGKLVAVDRTPLKEVSRPLLASLHGGEILVSPKSRAPLLAQEAVYRVTIRPEEVLPKPTTMVVRGTVRIETDLRFVAENLVFRALSLVLRESGI